jgi:hypothetical protein
MAVPQESIDLFQNLLGIKQVTDFFFENANNPVLDVSLNTALCPCCHRTKQGLFLETSEMENSRFYCRLWTPWGGIPMVAILPWRILCLYLSCLGIEPFSENYITVGENKKLYPVQRFNLPCPLLFEEGDPQEKNEQDIKQKAHEWRKLLRVS